VLPSNALPMIEAVTDDSTTTPNTWPVNCRRMISEGEEVARDRRLTPSRWSTAVCSARQDRRRACGHALDADRPSPLGDRRRSGSGAEGVIDLLMTSLAVSTLMGGVM